MKQKDIFQMFNPENRRYETVDLEEAELAAGDIVMRLYWSEAGRRYVSVPGATVYRVSGDLELKLVRE